MLAVVTELRTRGCGGCAPTQGFHSCTPSSVKVVIAIDSSRYSYPNLFMNKRRWGFSPTQGGHPCSPFTKSKRVVIEEIVRLIAVSECELLLNRKHILEMQESVEVTPLRLQSLTGIIYDQ
jgi:hypothetical protein